MKKDIFQKLLLLKELQKNDNLESKIDKVMSLIENLSNCDGKIKEKYIYLKVIIGTLKCSLYEEIRKVKIKKELKRILNCEDEDIVYDENDISSNENATIIAGNIRYSASLSKKYLVNKKIIWGDLDISTLEDTSCLQNLELVGGDLLIRDNVVLPNLKYVLGMVEKIKINKINNSRYTVKTNKMDKKL